MKYAGENICIVYCCIMFNNMLSFICSFYLFRPACTGLQFGCPLCVRYALSLSMRLRVCSLQASHSFKSLHHEILILIKLIILHSTLPFFLGVDLHVNQYFTYPCCSACWHNFSLSSTWTALGFLRIVTSVEMPGFSQIWSPFLLGDG